MTIFAELTQKMSRDNFCSGNEAIDRYFREFVSQDIKNNIAKCIVAINEETHEIMGFFTLSAWALEQCRLDVSDQRGRYRWLPITLLGRLAVDQKYQGRGIASEMVAMALRLVEDSPMASAGLFVQPKEGMGGFYEKLGFVTIKVEGQPCYIKLLNKKRHY